MISLALRIGPLVCTWDLNRAAVEEEEAADELAPGSPTTHLERQPLCTDMEVEEAAFGFIRPHL